MLRGFKKKAPPVPDGQMELVEHLAELRTRLVRSIIYLVVGMVLTFNLFDEMFNLLAYPLAPILQRVGGTYAYTNITEPFLLRMQTAFISGLAMAFPFVIYEFWGFIAPALTPEERKPIFFLAPFSVLLFLAGIGTAYASLPAALGWMASFIPQVEGSSLLQNPQQYILLSVKILLSGGVAFQLPVVLLFLGRIGIINAELMTRFWRHAVVLIAAAAAVITPSNDPLTMMIIATPMTGLYALSISLVRAIEPRGDGTRKLSLAAMILAALAPVVMLVAIGYWLWRTSSGG